MALWTPANLATASSVWLQADNLGLSDGASVTSWPDSSGHGESVFTPGWASSPTFQTNQLNSLGIVRFTTAQALRWLKAGLDKPYTFFVVGRTTVAGTVGRVFSGMADTGQNWVMGWANNEEGYMYMGGFVYQSGAANTTNWYQYAATGDGVTAQMYRDGTSLASNSNGTNGMDGRLSLNGAYQNSANAQSACELAEVIVCAYVISATDREYVEGYLAWKWGRQAALPGGHPYASAAPTYDPIAGVNFLRKGDRRA